MCCTDTDTAFLHAVLSHSTPRRQPISLRRRVVGLAEQLHEMIAAHLPCYCGQGIIAPVARACLSLATSGTAVHDVVNEYVAFRAEVVLAVRTPISSEWAHAFARGASHRLRCILERTGTGMARFARIRCIVQCHPMNMVNALIHGYMSTWRGEQYSHSLVRLDREQVVVTPREVGRAHDHEPAYIAVRRDVAHLRAATRAQEALAL